MPDIVKSKNNVGFSDDYQFEYTLIDGQVYKCELDADFDTEGNRVGTWECSRTMGLQHPTIYPFLQSTSTSDWQTRVYNSPVKGRGSVTQFRSPVTGTFISIE